MIEKKFRARRTVAVAAFVLLGAGATACAKAKTDTNASSQTQDPTADAAIANVATSSSGAPTGAPVPRQLPPQLFDACMGKAASDACQVTFPGTRTIEGTCTESVPPETRLLCRLKNPSFFGNRPHHGPLPGTNGGMTPPMAPPPPAPATSQ